VCRSRGLAVEATRGGAPLCVVLLAWMTVIAVTRLAVRLDDDVCVGEGCVTRPTPLAQPCVCVTAVFRFSWNIIGGSRILENSICTHTQVCVTSPVVNRILNSLN
jgi:hypothetical protein